jgi:biopolymer transport protein ExbB/TolQ
MSNISSYTLLQDKLGRNQPEVIKTFLEEARMKDTIQIATKKDLHDLELRISNRIQWTAVVQIIAALGPLIGLSKLF